MKYLITGGAGYIGSTICSALEDAGHTPVILGSLITGREEFTRGRIFYKGDIADEKLVTQLLRDHPDIQATVHCAALIVVPDSVSSPYEYYQDNVSKSVEFFYTLQRKGYKLVVFSSSAALYDVVPDFMVTEEAPIKPISPYARTKFMMEMVLKDFCSAYGMKGIALRYFNPIGAHPSGEIGEDPNDIPNNLFPFICQVAAGRREQLAVFGDDWPTPDGTGVRDYLHVVDLAAGHLRAFEFVQRHAGMVPVNLGTGRGVSVLQLVRAFEAATGQPIAYRIVGRRPGDIAECWADPTSAERLLGWRAEFGVERACADGWRWQRRNPDGYRTEGGIT